MRLRVCLAHSPFQPLWPNAHEHPLICTKLARTTWRPLKPFFDCAIAQAAQDPHFVARQAVIDLPDADLGSIKAPCLVPRFTGRPLPVPHTGPHHGEHNDAFYGALGLSAQDLADLRSSQSI